MSANHRHLLVATPILRHNGVQRGDNADVNRKGTELARPAVLDLKQEAELNVETFTFKPLQLAALIDPKSLKALEILGGVEGLLRAPSTIINDVTPFCVEMCRIS